jgi:hypothetical protein
MVQRVNCGTSRRRAMTPLGSCVRQVLTKYRQSQVGPSSRWFIPGAVDEILVALRDTNRPVIVSSLVMWRAIAGARRDFAPFAPGGAMAGKYFLVDEHDQVTEWEDVDTHPARLEQVAAHDGQHRDGDYVCGQCCPDGCGRQCVELEPTFPPPEDWCFVPADQDDEVES